MLKESDDLDILGVTFDFMMTFENHLCSVTRAASKMLGILRNPHEYSMRGLFLGDAFGVCSARFGVVFYSVVIGCRCTP